jgi:hypothetical protein
MLELTARNMQGFTTLGTFIIDLETLALDKQDFDRVKKGSNARCKQKFYNSSNSSNGSNREASLKCYKY